MPTTYSLLADPSDKFEVVDSQLRLRNLLATGTSATALVSRNDNGVVTNFEVIVDAVPKVRTITTKTGRRPATLTEMQSYNDYVAFDSNDANTHPHFPTFTHVAVKNGNWSDPTLWDAGTVPGDNAVVNTSTFDVTYDVYSTALIWGIHNSGTGTFRIAHGMDTLIWVYTFMLHGTFINDEAVESPTLGKPRHERVFWFPEAPGATVKGGMNTMGPRRERGAPKTHCLPASATLAPGATSATVPGMATSGWRVKDKILFVTTEDAGLGTDPQYTGPTQFYGPDGEVNGVRTRNASAYKLSKDEVRTITDITGDVVTWDAALTYPHTLRSEALPNGDIVTMPPLVANLSRSIVARSADASDTVWVGDLTDLQKRAHDMAMFCDDVQIRYVEARNMARTSTDPSLTDPGGVMRYATADTSQPISVASNVRGRYAFHIHGTGPYYWRNMAVVEGCVAWAPQTEVPMPGWAFTHHNSRASFERNVGYNGRGALMVSELGNEIGQWIGNVMAWARGDGFNGYNWGQRQELWTNHNGHAGTAYENQARQILQQDNVAASARCSWHYNQQNTNAVVRTVDEHSLRLRDPMTLGGGSSTSGKNNYGPEQPQIPYFKHNVSYDCGAAFLVAHRANSLNRSDATPMVVEGMHGVKTGTDFQLVNYSFAYNFYDSLWLGLGGTGAGAAMGPVSWEFNFSNIKIKDKANAFANNGVEANYNGFIIDTEWENISGTPLPIATAIVADADDALLNHPRLNFMGPWTKISPTLLNIRTWDVLDSATDLPQQYPLPPLSKHLPDGSPIVAYGDEPYFVWDSDIVTSTAMTGSSASLSGVIRDSVGDRKFPDNQNPEANMANLNVKPPRTMMNGMTGELLVLRNGCFNDAGTWKTRLWFSTVDRASKVELAYHIDITLTGTAGYESFLADNTVDPDATKPTLFLKPETVPTGPVILDTTIPVVTTPDTTFATDNQPLSFALQASKGQGKWTLGGTDAALFEVGGGYRLRWAGDVVKSALAPDDANADGGYDITLTFTDQFGNVSDPKPLTVQLAFFTDEFDGEAGMKLTDRTGWTYVSGGNIATVDGSGNLSRPTSGAQNFARSYDLSSYDQAVEATIAGASTSGVLLRFQDANNYIIIARQSGTPALVVRQMKAGVSTELGRYAAPTIGSVVRAEVFGDDITVKVNGVTQQTVAGGPASGGLSSVTMSDPPPNSYGVGVVGTAGSGSGAWLSRVTFEPL